MRDYTEHPPNATAVAPQTVPLSAKTQRSKILRLLVDAKGGWVAAPVIAACALQYSARIFELRRTGFVIENRTARVDGALHSWFRLIPRPACPEAPEPCDPDATNGCWDVPARTSEDAPPPSTNLKRAEVTPQAGIPAPAQPETVRKSPPRKNLFEQPLLLFEEVLK